MMQTVNSPPWSLLELEYGFEAGLASVEKGWDGKFVFPLGSL